jgi:hypothetical protein
MTRALAMARDGFWVLGAGLVLASLISTPAFASATFPPTIQADLGLASPPPCTLCHRNDLGGAGTVVSPFGRTLVNHFGLTSTNTDGLKGALAGDDAQHLDSDGDGVPDIDELRAGSDPNLGLPGQAPPIDVPLPETGCTFAVHAPADRVPALVLVLAGLVLLSRRTRERANLGAPKCFRRDGKPSRRAPSSIRYSQTS